MNDARLNDLELKISKVLRTGVLFSGALMALGWLTSLGGAHPFAAFQQYQQVPLSTSLHQVWSEGRWSTLLVYAGLVVLVLLPGLRVFLTAVLFFRQREYKMAAIALFVLVILIVSFSLGIESV